MNEPAPVRSHLSTRSKARKRALDVLFEAELRGDEPLHTLQERETDANPPLRPYTIEVVRGVVAHAAEIDAQIAAHLATGWTLGRLPRVDRNVLRVAVWEIEHGEVPHAVAVSEAVAMVAELSTDDSPAFVHGVLGALTGSKPGGQVAGHA